MSVASSDIHEMRSRIFSFSSDTSETDAKNCFSYSEGSNHLDIQISESSNVVEEFFSFKSDTSEAEAKNFSSYDQGSNQLDIHRSEISNVERYKTRKIELRNYQLELARKSLDGKNCIIIAPTGSGKTFVVGQIFKKLYEERKRSDVPFKAVFLVCQRILLEQQMKALIEFFGGTTEPSKNTARIGKDIDNVPLASIFANYDILVMTGQILMNSIKNKEVDISKLDLIAFDECHRTDLNHVYNEIMWTYLELKYGGSIDPNRFELVETKLPQIVGITATLGVGNCDEEEEVLEHYVKMCANLDCSGIEFVRKHQKELLKFSPEPTLDTILECQPKSMDNAYGMNLLEILRDIESFAFPDFKRDFQPGTQMYENQAVMLKKSADSSKLYLGFIAEVLIMLNRAFMLFLDFSAQDSFEFIDENFQNPLHFHDKVDINREKIMILWQEKSEKMHKLANQESNVDNPKLNELKRLLRSIFQKNRDAKGILLTRTKKSVDIFLKFLDLNDICRPTKLVGHSEMTDAEQQAAIRKFTYGDNNLFVATDVAQEGLDLPACNFVIRYNFVSNEIGSVQARGRARAAISDCYLIIDQNSPDLVRELRNRAREILMVKTLTNMDKLSEIERVQRIEFKQNSIYEEILRNKNKKSEQTKIDGNLIEIVCKNCKQKLCRGDEIIKRGSNYVCIKDVESFGNDLKVTPVVKKDYKTESYKGMVHCNGTQCRNLLGRVLQYPFGDEYSFKCSQVMYRESTPATTHYVSSAEVKFEEIKQWSKVGFAVDESPMLHGCFQKFHFVDPNPNHRVDAL